MIELKYKEIRPGFSMKGWGAEKYEKANVWMSSLIEPLEDKFCEGMKLLDYGCGNGRISNFLSGRLRDYTYYGIEPQGQPGIDIAKQTFNDSRHHFGYIGTDLETKALSEVDCIILGSIFTHLSFNDFKSIMEKFKNSIMKGAVVSFSIFTDTEYKEIGRGAYGLSDCYNLVYYTEKQLNDWVSENNYTLKEFPSYIAQCVHIHRMFKLCCSTE
jgi:2-polyprenyl-3-methyl-5-hydroxy-6-metoxy-1,4-benzoquinol methylase